MELETARGIGEKQAEKLRGKGVMTLEDLAVMSTEELQSLVGCSYKVAKEIQEDALSKTIEKVVEVKLFEESEKYIKEKVRHISTGSKELDRILGGGVRTDATTMFFGPFASSKTQLGYQLMVNCLDTIPESKVMFIETEPSCFSPVRVREIRASSGKEVDYNRIFHIPARTIATPSHQYLAYLRTKKLLEKGESIKLIIIDSFTAKFRGFFQKREQLGDRSREFARHFMLFDLLASKYNLAVFLTAQVMGVPTSPKEQVMALGRPESTVFGLRGQKVWGGETITHSAAYVLALSRGGKDYWKAKIIDAPDLPEEECYFCIRPEGIRDYVGKGKAQK